MGQVARTPTLDGSMDELREPAPPASAATRRLKLSARRRPMSALESSQFPAPDVGSGAGGTGMRAATFVMIVTTRPAGDDVKGEVIARARATSGFELAHLLGQHPQRAVQADTAVDAADRAGVDAPALRRSSGLTAAHGVFL